MVVILLSLSFLSIPLLAILIPYYVLGIYIYMKLLHRYLYLDAVTGNSYSA
jgi:hypothetical protein